MSTVASAPHPLLPKAEHNNVRAAMGSLDWKEGL